MEATIYVRISQDRLGDQVSVDNQQRACERLVEQRGWTVREVFVDNDLSATSGVKRPAFEQLLASNPEAVVCWHTDRLIRLTSDLERVIDLGVNVYAVEAGDIDLSHPAGRAIARTITAWATYEGEQRTARQRLALEARAQTGKPFWSGRPFGHNLDGTVHPIEAPLVRHWAASLLAGGSIRSIMREANEAGVTSARGNPWTVRTVVAMLRRARLAGIAVYQGKEIGKGDWEPILDEATWRGVVALLDRNAQEHRQRSKGPRRAFLTGIVRCGVCLSRCTGATSHGNSVYRCQENWCVSRRRSHVDKIVSERALAVLSRPQMREALSTPADDNSDAQRALLASLKARLNEATHAYSAGVFSLAQITDISATLNAEIAATERALAATTKNTPLHSLLNAEDIATEWGALGEDRQRVVIKTLFDVLLDPTGQGRRAIDRKSVRCVPAGTATRFDPSSPA